MSGSDCIFCKIISGDIPAAKIFEDEIVLSFLDIGPISDGHTLVVPKHHFGRLHECPSQLLGQIASRLGRIAKAVVTATGAEGYNVLCNNGRCAGQVVEHLHFHIIPRRSGDGLFESWPAYKYPEGEIEALAERIRKNL